MPSMKKRSSSKSRSTGKSKSAAKSGKSRGGKTRSRQFYSEIGSKGARARNAERGKSRSSKKSTKSSSRKVTPTRELLSEIKTVGRDLRRRVKRAL